VLFEYCNFFGCQCSANDRVERLVFKMVDMANGTSNSASVLFYLYFCQFCDFVTNQSVMYMIVILTYCVCYFLKTHMRERLVCSLTFNKCFVDLHVNVMWNDNFH